MLDDPNSHATLSSGAGSSPRAHRQRRQRIPLDRTRHELGVGSSWIRVALVVTRPFPAFPSFSILVVARVSYSYLPWPTGEAHAGCARLAAHGRGQHAARPLVCRGYGGWKCVVQATLRDAVSVLRAQDRWRGR